VKDRHLFISSTFQRLSDPFLLEGVGGSVTITHCGKLIHIPAPFNKAYYSADLSYNLFSLGVIQRLGGFYSVDPDNQLRLLIKTSPHGSIIATAHLSESNLLPFTLPSTLPHSPVFPPSPLLALPLSLPSPSPSPISVPSFPVPLSLSTLPSSTIFHNTLPSHPIPSILPSIPSDSMSLFSYTIEQLAYAGYTKRLDGSIIVTPSSPVLPLPTSSHPSIPLPFSPLIPQYNTEQRTRAKLALEVHNYNHASNISNGTACESGIIPIPLTAKDFTVADDIYGACGACVSKDNSTITHGATSNSPPPVSAGQLLHADLIKLKDNSQVLLTKDDYCGNLKPMKLYGGKTKENVRAGWDAIRLYYNERGCILGQVNTDSEEVFKESASILQERGILCSLSPPNTHEKSLERSWQTVQKRMAVVTQSLTFVLPLGLQYSLLEHVCDLLNSYGNSKFPHSSPHIILNGTHNGYDKFPGHLPISFGSVVQSRESDIVPQTGLVVGVTPNSSGSHKVYFPCYDGQKGATILHRRVSELTVIYNYPREWHLVPQVIPLRGPVRASCLPSLVPSSPVSQPILNPLLVPSPLLTSLSSPLPPPISIPLALHPSLLSPSISTPPPIPLSPIISSSFLPPPPLQSLPLVTSLPPSPFPSPPISVLSPPTLPPISLPLIPIPLPVIPHPLIPLPSLSPLPMDSLPPPSPRRSTRLTKTPLRFLLATSPPTTPPLKFASIRRNALARQATARNSQYLIDTSNSRSTMPTDNRHIPVTLLPPQHKSSEISNREAMKYTGLVATKIQEACNSEMFKLEDTYDTFRVIRECDIESDAIRVNSQMLYKPKPTDADPDAWKARLAACGNRISDDVKGDTYAGTADTRNTALITAAFGADAVKNGTLGTLRISNFDLPSAFINKNRLTREHTGGKQVVMKIQDTLPHPLAGKWVEVLGALYGLPWSNHIFWLDFDKTMAKAQFFPIQIPDEPCVSTPIDNHIYSRFDPDDPTKKLVVSVTVDDGYMVGQGALRLEQELIAVLKERYGDNITYNEVTTNFCGFALTRHEHGALSFDLEKYILKTVKQAGLENAPGATAPSRADLFSPPTNPTPSDQSLYATLMGRVTHIAQLRYDIVKEATHLAKVISTPTVSDMEKLVLVIRYLHYTAGDGPTYYTDEGAILYAWVDVAFAVHVNGRSQTGYYLCIGKHSAPFYARAEEQKSCIALGPSEGEYVGMSEAGKAIIRFRHVLAAIGFPQSGPTIMFEDSNSAIKLAQGPSIKRKSKHIFVREHYIRDLIKQDLVDTQFVRTANQRADLFTKPKTPSKHIYESERLLNKLSRIPPKVF
jgi:hypothetical protein